MFTAVTMHPGTGAPLGSYTTPEILPTFVWQIPTPEISRHNKANDQRWFFILTPVLSTTTREALPIPNKYRVGCH